ncbi:MAG: PD40 domain-containing protein [Balneolaceae bacterium]|nr:PD40 domain-containing protein [Balneolaceae bacterium]
MFYLLISSIVAPTSFPIDEPQRLAPGIISTEMGEFNPTYDVDRGEFYFMRRTPGLFDYTIMVSMKTESGWSEPEVASFSGEHRDDSPYLSADGNTLFFDSDRPHPEVASRSINIWKTERGETGWSEPKLVRSASINNENESEPGRDEFGPVLDGNDNLVFYSFRAPFRGGKRFQLSSGDNYQNLQTIDDLPDPSARTFVSYISFSNDGKTAIMDGRHPGRRDAGLFYSCKDAFGDWSEAELLPKVNTTSSESGPRLSSDSSLLFYVSNTPAKLPLEPNGDIFFISTEELPVPCE